MFDCKLTLRQWFRIRLCNLFCNRVCSRFHNRVCSRFRDRVCNRSRLSVYFVDNVQIAMCHLSNRQKQVIYNTCMLHDYNTCIDVKSVRVYWRLLHEFMLWPEPVGLRHAITVGALQNAWLQISTFWFTKQDESSESDFINVLFCLSIESSGEITQSLIQWNRNPQPATSACKVKVVQVANVYK